MEAYLLDWVNLLLRWVHVITGIAWIGASFYFVLLDSSLTKPESEELKSKGVDGELWAVHGGGFYHSNKYMVAPRWRALPENLHWSYWESYSTWLSGFALFTVMYLFNASTFLVDKNVHDWLPAAAAASALGFLVAFWLVYDLICRSLGQSRNGNLIVGVSVFILVVFASWVACQLFAGRASFLLVGAMLATTMSANVFFVIIPGQRKVVAQLRAGESPDPIYGKRGKQRSVHNTYFTLPVLIAMLSNHYGWLYQAPGNWLVLVLMMLAGALIRHSFVSRHKAHVEGRRTPWEYAVVGTVVIVALMIWMAPKTPSAQDTEAAGNVTYADMRSIIDRRCLICHNPQIQNKNVDLHDAAGLRKNAQNVYLQATVLKLMPLNNATQITDSERLAIKRWYESGASTE